MEDEIYHYKPEEVLGVGTEKTVYPHLNDGDKIVGVFHENFDGTESAEKVSARFFLHKIARLLFADDFPEVYAVSSDPSIIVAKRVNVVKTMPEIRKIDYQSSTIIDSDLSPTEKYGVQEFIKATKEDGIDIDWDHANFCYDENGKLCYLDTLLPWENLRPDEQGYDPRKLTEALEKLPEPQRSKGLGYLEALEDLRGIEGKRLDSQDGRKDLAKP